ncbi:MAG: TonB-dependent receptor [Sphingomonas bacterium]
MSGIRFGMYLAASALAIGCHSMASAQTAPASATGDAAAAQQPVQQGGIPDIVITANKREQKLNDVGISVAVLGAQDLQQKQISSLQDIAQTVPGLSFTQGITGAPVYTLRGVGFYETSLAAYPSVSVYIDEQPLAFPALTQHSAFDLERIEVLKGPQGTLFGQNATGGAINYIAAKPTDMFKAGASLSYGRFNQVIGEGYISGPLTSTLSARLAGRFERADGWQYSTTRPGDRNGKAENYEGRLILSWEPSSSARFTLNLNGWKDNGETQGAQYIALQPQQVGWVPPAIESAPFTPLNARASDWSNSSWYYPNHKVPFRDNYMYQAALRAEVDIGGIGTLTSLTNYVRYREHAGTDFDASALNVFEIPLDDGSIKSFTQELRLSNGGSSALRYVIGGNYERSIVHQALGNQYTYTSANLYFGTVFGEPFEATVGTSDQTLTNYAAFGNLEYDILPNLTLKGGLRYTNSKDKYSFCETDPEAPYYAGNLLHFFSNLLSGNPNLTGPYQPGTCVTMNVSTSQPPSAVDPSLPLYAPGRVNNTLHEDNVSWRAGIDFKPRPGILLYANVSKGYKAGSFPTVNGTVFGQYAPVRQESVLSYEGGFKATLLDRTLQLNGAAFHYDYSDKQLRTKFLDPVFGQLDMIQNIPKSHITGFELEASIHPIRHFSVNAAYTYLDSKIDQYVGVDAGGTPNVNFAGTRIPFTPKHQIAVSTDYEQPLTSSLVGFIGASITYRSDTISVVGGDTTPAAVTAKEGGVTDVYGIGSYALVDGQIGIKSADDRWRAFVWGKNITNSYYWTNVVSGYDTVTRFAGMPATYGVTVGFSF